MFADLQGGTYQAKPCSHTSCSTLTMAALVSSRRTAMHTCHLRSTSETCGLGPCTMTDDTQGTRPPAGRAYWISGPSPWPLGHSVTCADLQGGTYQAKPCSHTSCSTFTMAALVSSRMTAMHTCHLRSTSETCGLGPCTMTDDTEGTRAPAGRAQWISGPSP